MVQSLHQHSLVFVGKVSVIDTIEYIVYLVCVLHSSETYSCCVFQKWLGRHVALRVKHVTENAFSYELYFLLYITICCFWKLLKYEQEYNI